MFHFNLNSIKFLKNSLFVYGKLRKRKKDERGRMQSGNFQSAWVGWIVQCSSLVPQKITHQMTTGPTWNEYNIEYQL